MPHRYFFIIGRKRITEEQLRTIYLYAAQTDCASSAQYYFVEKLTLGITTYTYFQFMFDIV